MVTTVSLPAPPGRPRPSLPLQYLDLSDCNAVDDTSVRLAVENCTQLQYLFIRRCTALTGTVGTVYCTVDYSFLYCTQRYSRYSVLYSRL